MAAVQKMDVRAELAARVDAIAMRAAMSGPAELARELDCVRTLAAAHGIGAAVTVVHALDSALARGDQGPLIQGWIAILKDAVGTEAQAVRPDLFAAACTVRLAG